MNWLVSLLLLQADAAPSAVPGIDPATKALLESGNPLLMVMGGLIVLGMFISSIDKIAFWKNKRKNGNGHDYSKDVAETLKGIHGELVHIRENLAILKDRGDRAA